MADVILLNLLLAVFNKNLLQNVIVLKQFRDNISENAGYLLLNINHMQGLAWIFIFGEHISFSLYCDNLLSYGTLCDLPQHCFPSYLNPLPRTSPLDPFSTALLYAFNQHCFKFHLGSDIMFQQYRLQTESLYGRSYFFFHTWYYILKSACKLWFCLCSYGMERKHPRP